MNRSVQTVLRDCRTNELKPTIVMTAFHRNAIRFPSVTKRNTEGKKAIHVDVNSLTNRAQRYSGFVLAEMKTNGRLRFPGI